MVRIDAEPNGAADTGPTGRGLAPSLEGGPGRNGARCALTPMGPTPGPPPPWGMQNVLCKLRWLTSAPKRPGAASPTRALRLAPSTYTWPPWSCTMAQTSAMAGSNTPWVDG